MQKKDGINSSIGHVFTLSEVRTVQIEVRINDKSEISVKNRIIVAVRNISKLIYAIIISTFIFNFS